MFCYGKVDNLTNQKAIMEEIFRLRYKVYVDEWKFESPTEHQFGLEQDQFDKHSIHFYSRSNQDKTIIGTVRIIMNSPLGFPIENHFEIEDGFANVPRNEIGEISRLAVSKFYRRRAIDNAIFGSGGYDPGHIPRYMDEGRDVRRHCEHDIVRGLYIWIYRESKQRSLTHWYAVMSKGLYIILKRWGISFRQIGDEKYYHGLRAPYLANIEEVEDVLAERNPDLLNEARECIIN